MQEEFPDLIIGPNIAGLSKWGYEASWKVGPELPTLVEAATMAQVFMSAGKVQFDKVNKLNK